MNSKFTFNPFGLFTTDNSKMVEFYRDIMEFSTDWVGKGQNVMMHHGVGQRPCYIADPEGNLIEIHSFTQD